MPASFRPKTNLLPRIEEALRGRHHADCMDCDCGRDLVLEGLLEASIEEIGLLNEWADSFYDDAMKERSALWHMVDKFKPFTLKPVGSQCSQARLEQEEQIAAYKRASELLAELRVDGPR